MPAGNTYEAIATQTLGSAAATVTFSSIPGSYTDLVLVANAGQVTGNNGFRFQVNSDTASNYSYTYLLGNGSAASSGRGTSSTSGESESLMATTLTGTFTLQFMNYSNATTYKTILVRGGDASQKVDATVNLWQSTSAITSITLFPGGGQSFITGSTFSLYGIKAA
jgi:hypothetical protein